MKKKGFRKRILSVVAASSLILGAVPALATAKSPDTQTIPQGVSASVLGNANYFGDMDPNALVTVDIVLKIQNQQDLANFINETVTKGSSNYHKYVSVSDFKNKYALPSTQVDQVVKYLNSFGLQTTVYPDNLIITATGTVKHLNEAFNVELENASYHGKEFHASRHNPTAPKEIADNILCILGLADYSNLVSNATQRPEKADAQDTPQGPLSLTPQDLVKQYDVQPLYDQGATGAGQTMGIVTLASFNKQDAYHFWQQMGIPVKANRINEVKVDGGAGWNGYEETTIDVDQSGALAPQANINVYEAPNSDTGFVDGFAKAISDNQVQSLSVSWGESEGIVDFFTQLKMETPEYGEAFNQLFMEAAAQGISTFAAAGDAGAYDTGRLAGYGFPDVYALSVDNPADSPYITAAGGTTLPFHFHSNSTGIDVQVNQERAWGWDYLGNYFNARGIDPANLVNGGGGGFSTIFDTPDYQLGVPGVNSYSAVQDFNFNDDLTEVLGFNNSPSVVTGTNTGRNLPDLSMDADPYTGYFVYVSDPGNSGKNGGWGVWGGTSFVSPQLNGLTALINSANHTQVGFWNPQIYQFATQSDSPFHPLNTSGNTNDNGYFTGTEGTVYNQATGLGTPDVAALAAKFSK